MKLPSSFLRAGILLVLAGSFLSLAAPVRTDAALFRRGDANADGSLDISDAVNILSHLFLGEPVDLPCDDAADADDSGEKDITDPIFILEFLFLSGPPLPGPLVCGSDPTPDRLGCAIFPACPQPPGLEVTPGRGGVLASADGRLILEVPVGAVAEPTTITVRRLSGDEIPEDLRAGAGPAGAVWELGPDGAVFRQPLRVTYTAPLGDIVDPGRIEEDGVSLPVLLLRSGDGTIEQAENSSVEVDLDAGTVAAAGEVRHFSDLAVKNGPLTAAVVPEMDTRVRGERLPFPRIIFKLTQSVLFTFERYDVLSTDNGVLGVLDHKDLAGLEIIGPTGFFEETVDFPILICREPGTARWGPEFSGRWGPGPEPAPIPSPVPLRGRLETKFLATGKVLCRPPVVGARKFADFDRVQTGSIIRYAVSVGVVDGIGEVTDLEISDQVPEGFIIDSVHPQPSIRNGNELRWKFDTSQAKVVNYWVRVRNDFFPFPPEEHLVLNTARIETGQGDPVEVSAAVTVVQKPSALRVYRFSSFENSEGSPLDKGWFEVRVENAGNTALTNLQVIEQPDGAAPIVLPDHIFPPGLLDVATGAITWDVPELGPGALFIGRYTAGIPPADAFPADTVFPVDKISRADAVPPAGDGASGEQLILIVPEEPDQPLAVEKTDGTGGVAARGERVRITVTLANRSATEILTDLFVADDIFSQEYVAAVENITHGGVFEPVARIKWSKNSGAAVTELAPGESVTFEYDMVLRDDVPDGAFVFNRVHADAAETREGSPAKAQHVLLVRDQPPDPTQNDTDGGGVVDAVEELLGTDPTDPNDDLAVVELPVRQLTDTASGNHHGANVNTGGIVSYNFILQAAPGGPPPFSAVRVVGVGGGDFRELARQQGGPPNAILGAIAGRSDRVYYLSSRFRPPPPFPPGFESKLFTIGADGSGLAEVATIAGLTTFLAVAPDGETAAFQCDPLSGTTPGLKTCVARRNGLINRIGGAFSGNFCCPSVAVVRENGAEKILVGLSSDLELNAEEPISNSFEIFLAKLGGELDVERLERLTLTPRQDKLDKFDPKLSEDGSTIAYRAIGAGAASGAEALPVSMITGIDVASRTSFPIFTHRHRAPPANLGQVSLTKDGRKIVFSSNGDPLGTNPDLNSEVFLTNRSGSVLLQLTDTIGVQNAFAVIDLEGQFVIFQSSGDLAGNNADGNTEIFAILLGGRR